jgi:23S rRNA (cytosine1962-C5)-methyltransferase
MLNVYLKEGRERPVLHGHPWIFSGAIADIQGDAANAAVADVYDCRKNWLARGLYSPKSQIRVRVATWQKEPLDTGFFLRRISQALSLRQQCVAPVTDAYRLINGEGDFLPGLIVDRYADYLVCQFVTAGVDHLKTEITDAVGQAVHTKGIFEKSEGRVRKEEGLEPSVGVLAGETPPEAVIIHENGLKFMVDIFHGQKTGFFLDQRDNRLILSSFARGCAVLNCFAYTGAFSVYACAGGATDVVSMDSSRPALELAEKTLTLNGFTADTIELIKGDVFAFVKETDRKFDIIVLDPPSLAHKRNDVAAATGGYKFLNLHALRHLQPGGLLLTFSCSQHLSIDLFQKVVFGAAVDARRKVSVVRRLGQPLDHPFSLHHPEGEYLKGLAVRVLD